MAKTTKKRTPNIVAIGPVVLMHMVADERRDGLTGAGLGWTPSLVREALADIEAHYERSGDEARACVIAELVRRDGKVEEMANVARDAERRRRGDPKQNAQAIDEWRTLVNRLGGRSVGKDSEGHAQRTPILSMSIDDILDYVRDVVNESCPRLRAKITTPIDKRTWLKRAIDDVPEARGDVRAMALEKVAMAAAECIGIRSRSAFRSCEISRGIKRRRKKK